MRVGGASKDEEKPPPPPWLLILKDGGTSSTIENQSPDTDTKGLLRLKDAYLKCRRESLLSVCVSPPSTCLSSASSSP